MKVLIGVVGEKGSGKQVFSDFFKKISSEKVEHVRYSDLLSETLELWSLPKTRHNLQNLAIVMDGGYGKGTLCRAVVERIKKLKAEVVILDGVRWKSDAQILREIPNCVLIYITADLKKRYLRLKAKSDKVGEKGVSFAQFLREEKAKTEIEIGQVGEKADYRIENNGSLDELQTQVREFWKKLISR